MEKSGNYTSLEMYTSLDGEDEHHHHDEEEFAFPGSSLSYGRRGGGGEHGSDHPLIDSFRRQFSDLLVLVRNHKRNHPFVKATGLLLATVVVASVMMMMMMMMSNHHKQTTTPSSGNPADNSNGWNQLFFDQSFNSPNYHTASKIRSLDANAGYAKVSINGDGTVLAVGEPNYDVDGQKHSGRVMIVEEQQGSSSQLVSNASPLVESRPHTGDTMGTAVSLSGDGNSLAVGVPRKDSSSNSTFHGSVDFYQRNQQRSLFSNVTFFIEMKKGDWTGSAVAVNHDGSVLLVGVPLGSIAGGGGGGGRNTGEVRVFEKGLHTKTFRGMCPDGWFGSNLDVSAKGSHAMVMANGCTPKQIHVLERVRGTWERATILSLNNDDEYYQHSAVLSADGETIVMIAASVHSDHYVLRTWKRQKQSGEWKENQDSQKLAKNAHFYHPASLALSEDGSVLAVAMDDHAVVLEWQDSNNDNSNNSNWKQQAKLSSSSSSSSSSETSSSSLCTDVTLSYKATRLAAAWYSDDSDDDEGGVSIGVYDRAEQ